MKIQSSGSAWDSVPQFATCLGLFLHEPIAARHFEAAWAADPSHRQACYNLGLVYERLGRKEMAQQYRARFEELSRKDGRQKPVTTAIPKS